MSELLHVFKHEGYEAAWEKLSAWRQMLTSPRKCKAADRPIPYVVERRGIVDYPEFLQRNRDIGSGPTESRCKVATSRLKRADQRWNTANSEATAALTTLILGGQWQLHRKPPTTAST